MSTSATPPPPKPGLSCNSINVDATSDPQFEEDLRIVSHKAPKDDLVLYFGRDEFSDNAKYQFLHAAQNGGGFQHVWCTYNKKLVQDLRAHGLEAFDVTENPNRTVQVLLRARVAVFTMNPAESLRSRIFLAALAGAIKVQLWHGIGVKRMELQNIEHKNMLDISTVSKMRFSTEIDCIVSPSVPFDAHWRETFGVQNVIRAGYPRNEVLLREATAHELINVPKNLVRESKRKKVLFVPTWGSAGEKHWTKGLDAICDAAKKNDVDLYLKPHPYEAPVLPKAEFSKNGPITIVSPSIDLYPLLKYFDCMVTNHSSMAFDAFLLNMPLVFMEANDKRFYMTEMLEPVVAPTIGSFLELDRLQDLLGESQQWAKNRELAAQKYFETPPLDAARTIHDTILQLAKAA